jgi:hypothetical protein
MRHAKNRSKCRPAEPARRTTSFTNTGYREMFARVRRVKSILQFLRERAPHYGPLARDDLHKFRDEIVKASVGASISAAAGLIFACFLSIAVIVSAWDGLHRTAVAWAVCCGWGVLALGGLWYARKAISGPPPFQLMAGALARDYTRLLALADREEP